MLRESLLETTSTIAETALEYLKVLRVLNKPREAREHWGESAIIAVASRARTLAPIMLCDDHGARVAANDNGIKPYGVHKLLSLMIKQNRITATDAETHANALNLASRFADYTAAELASFDLGRAGEP